MASVFMTCLCRESTASKKKKKKNTNCSVTWSVRLLVTYTAIQIVPVARTHSNTRALVDWSAEKDLIWNLWLHNSSSCAFCFSFRNEYLIFQKIIKLEYDFPEKFFSKAKDLVEKLLVSLHDRIQLLFFFYIHKLPQMSLGFWSFVISFFFLFLFARPVFRSC